MESQISKTPQKFWKEKEAVANQVLNQVPNQVPIQQKPNRRLKSPKKIQEGRKSSNDIKIEDVFLNSEYFKHQKNVSSLSFCSGDNGEHQWTVSPKFGVPFRPKVSKLTAYPNDTIKSDTAMLADKSPKQWAKNNSQMKEAPKETLWEGFLSEKGKMDRDLITLITEQMFLAERELQVTRTHLMETISKLNERDLEIIQLHEKIQILQQSKKMESKDENPTKTSEDYQRLVMASEKLKKQVKDMEEFLNDYGLVWVGDKETLTKPNFDKIIKSFQRLNSVASQPKIIQTTLGAKFEIPREIPVELYSNGVLIRNDFREYNKMSTAMFLQDIEDGFFPSEFQIEFPEGVPFEVFDKRNEVYNKNGKIPVFQGRGNRLGSTFDGKPPTIVYLEPLKHTKTHESSTSIKSESHLKKLQKKRSRNISIFEDRNSIPSCMSTVNQKFITENEGKDEGRNMQGRLLKVKIRYGREKTESFVLDIKENEKLDVFQLSLQKKLCELYHDHCIVNFETNNKFADFEVHVYGSNAFRLSDRLHCYPKECGIVDNCVINVTEI